MQSAGRPALVPQSAAVRYERHRPEQTTLYRLVQQHASVFIAEAEAAAGADLPQFVKDEFDAFLECGILAHGFLRLRCGDCGRCPAHRTDGRAPGGPCHPPCAGAPVGAVTADPAAPAAGRATQAGDARAAGGATCVSLADRIAQATASNCDCTSAVGTSACGSAARMSVSCRVVAARSALRPVFTRAWLISSRISGLQCSRISHW